MIYDAFLFYNETELLDIRLHELAPVVDGFILVEATHTHQGKIKPMYFDAAKYQQYNIQHLISQTPYTDHPTLDQMRANEIAQRNKISEALQDKRYDLVIVSDVDEIPSREVVAELKALPRATLPIKVQHQSCYYYINQVGKPIFNNPYGAVALAVKDALRVQPQTLRQCLYDPTMPSVGGGWHVRFVGGPEGNKQKLEGVFPDGEYAKVRKSLKFKKFNGPYPHLVEEQPDRFQHLFRR